MSRYKLDKGEWEEIDPKITYKICCCDCFLVHEYRYKIVKGKVFVKTKRDERATGQVRRYNKKARIKMQAAFS